MEDLHRLSILLTAPGDMLSPDDDVAFHAAIAEATHNPLFERVIREPVDLLHDHMEAILSAYYAEPGGAIALQQQHEAIRRAIRAGDEQKARAAMRQHLDYVARGLAQLVGTGPRDAPGLHRPGRHAGLGAATHLRAGQDGPSPTSARVEWRWFWSRRDRPEPCAPSTSNSAS